MEDLLDALIGEELDALGEELGDFLAEPTCACLPKSARGGGSGQPTRKKRRKHKKRQQAATREDNQEEGIPLSQEAGVIVFPEGTLEITVDSPPRDDEKPTEQPEQTETETETETGEEPQPFVRVPVDVMWTRQGTHFVIDAPGIDREATKVEVAKRSLIISGIKRKDDLLLERETKVKRKERPAGPFVRKFKLPADADSDRAYSTYRDGVLHVTVPRRPAQAPHTPDVITIPVHDRFSCKTAQPADAEVTKPCSEINPEKSVPPKVVPVRVPVADAETARKLAAATREATGKEGSKAEKSPKRHDEWGEPRIIPLSGG